MQTFKKLFAFMLIALAIAPVLAMEPIKEEEMRAPLAPMLAALGEEPARSGDTVARVEMTDESSQDQENKTPASTSSIKAMGIAAINKSRALITGLKLALNKSDNSVVAEEAAQISLETPADVLVEVVEGKPAEMVPQLPLVSAKSQGKVAVKSIAGLRTGLISAFPVLGRLKIFSSIPVNIPVQQDSFVMHPANAAVLQIEGGFIGPVPAFNIDGGQEAVEVILETPAEAVVVEEEVVEPTRMALPESDDEDSAEEAAQADAAVEAEAARAAAVEAEVARAAAVEAEVARVAAIEAEAAPKTFAGKAKAFVGVKAAAVRDAYKFDKNAKLTSFAIYGGTAAAVAAVITGSYALYNYLLSGKKSVEVVEAQIAPVEPKVQSVTAPVVVKPAATKQVAKKARSSRKSSLVRAKCHGKKSCSSKGCK